MKSVIVAISGGVDSSVAAALLKNSGYEVIGVTFKNFDLSQYALDASSRSCCSLQALNNARMVCDRLDVPHYVLNRVELFEKRVIDNFREAYRGGLTPNPCIRCNSLVRWPELVRLATNLCVDFIATGHYARISNIKGNYFIIKAGMPEKDQSYALWALNPDYLAKTLFPVGEHSKGSIRDIARRLNLDSAFSRESQDICFVPEGRYVNMIGRSDPGDIIDLDGHLKGRHSGLAHYTIGQRRGLRIAHREPLYVVEIDRENNRLVVGPEGSIYNSEFEIRDTNWFIDCKPGNEVKCQAKIRYHHQPAGCLVQFRSGFRASVRFSQPQRAITPGQSAVFYDGDILLGGGIIDTVF
jgi:tRNA-specific 2-thiouridylase